MRTVSDLALAALGAVLALGAAACTSTTATDSTETLKTWAEKDRRICSEMGGYWQVAAGVCVRGGP
jgi:hypothetical protein